MTRRTAITMPFAAAAAQVSASASTAKTVLQPFNHSGVRLLDGMLRKQCLAVRDTFLQIADDDLLHGFRKRSGVPEPPGKPLGGWYGGDVFNGFGQYLSGMIRLSRALGDAAIGDKAHRLMTAWAQYIEPDGYFFYSRRPITPHYIYDKTMGGLVDLAEYGGHRDAIPFMEKITKWAEANLDRSRRRPLAGGATYDGNGEWYTLGENLYRAYEVSGDPRYRAFADVWRYPYYWDMFTRAEAPDPFGFHAYSHVNTLSSAAMAYSVSGDSHYLDVIRNAYDWLVRTQMYATGGFGPDEKLQRPDGSLGRMLESTWNNFETVCGSWAGFKLARYLLRFTGEARYGDWIEKLVYNGIGAALPLQLDGSNFYYSEYNVKGGRKDYKYAKWSCCSGTLPQATADYHNVVYFRDSEGLFVNLFVPSEAKWTQGGHAVTVVQTTDFPEAAHTELDVSPSEAATFDISFRVPRMVQRVFRRSQRPARCHSCEAGNVGAHTTSLAGWRSRKSTAPNAAPLCYCRSAAPQARRRPVWTRGSRKDRTGAPASRKRCLGPAYKKRIGTRLSRGVNTFEPLHSVLQAGLRRSI
jgi:hypothetical protein